MRITKPFPGEIKRFKDSIVIGMASERKFYWFGLSVSTLGSAENRTNRFVRADQTQSIGDLVAQELESMTSEFKIDKIDASKSFIPNAALAQDCIVCENSMP